MALAGELGADALPRLIDAAGLDHAVGTREIDVLEDAEALARLRERARAAHAQRMDGQELAGLDIAHEIRTDDVERAGLRGDDPGVAKLSQDQRPHAQGIA